MIVLERGGKVIAIFNQDTWELRGDSLWIGGKERCRPVEKANIHQIPAQDISHLFVEGPVGDRVLKAIWPDDFTLLSLDDQRLFIDRDTGTTINRVVHPTAGTDESIGTIRDMVVQIINAIGLAPTADFARLNEIAIAAIKEAAAKKAAITDA